MININKERLYNRLLKLGKIGKQETGGVTRLAFTEEDRQAENLIHSFMEEAGLTVSQDAVGNLIGRKEGRNPEAPAVLTGSHIDTVYNGGIFDGNLGVIGGIEALQIMNEQGIVTEHPIEVIAYKDEEGSRFNFSMFGSRGLCGFLSAEDLEYQDKQGVTIAEAMKAHGLDPKRFREAARPEGSIKAHVELHVEQNRFLQDKGLSVGVVSGINSSLWLKFILEGEAGHAGATPMEIRKDPLVAAAKIIELIEEEALQTETTVATVGKVHVQPGGINIIPGRVEFTLDLRDINKEVGDRAEERILSRAKAICDERGITMEIEVLQRVLPAPSAELVMNATKEAMRKLRLPVISLPSGACHDSMHLSRICPMGMIFVRSFGGSHNPDEWASAEDCADGVNVLYYTLLNLARAV